MNRMPLTGIWPEPVVTAMTWILANRLPGAKASDLDVSSIRIDNLGDGSRSDVPGHEDHGEISVHRLRDDLEVWQTMPSSCKACGARFAIAQPGDHGSEFLARYEIHDRRHLPTLEPLTHSQAVIAKAQPIESGEETIQIKMSYFYP